MKRIIFFLIILFFLLSSCTTSQREKPNQNSDGVNAVEPVNRELQPTSPKEIQCLLDAYPDFLASANDNLIIWKDGTSMIYDDGQEESEFETMLNQASLRDQMSLCYTKGKDYTKPPINFDPGRLRHEPFFYKIYGNSEEEVKTKITEIDWLPQNFDRKVKLKVTTLNGIDQKFKAISDELDALPQEYMKYLENPGGTFNWRTIAGTSRISTHSFGMTVDINVAHSNYWRDDKPDANGIYKYKNSIPMQIVEIFEKHGFIWGGKWYHYDTMHFEYRPELLSEKCLCQ